LTLRLLTAVNTDEHPNSSMQSSTTSFDLVRNILQNELNRT